LEYEDYCLGLGLGLGGKIGVFVWIVSMDLLLIYFILELGEN